MTPAEDRYAMAAAAVADRPGLEASRIELDRGGPSYTIDTVRQLRLCEPDAEFFMVVGSDVVGTLDTWHHYEDLRDLVTVAVVDRPGAAQLDPPPGWRSVRVVVRPVDVSSTDLRSVLEAGGTVEGLVPDAVIRCMAERGLYATGR